MDLKDLAQKLTNDIRVDYNDCDDMDNYNTIRDVADLVNSLLISIVATANDIDPKVDKNCTEAKNIKKMLNRKLKATQSILEDLE